MMLNRTCPQAGAVFLDMVVFCLYNYIEEMYGQRIRKGDFYEAGTSRNSS